MIITGENYYLLLVDGDEGPLPLVADDYPKPREITLDTDEATSQYQLIPGERQRRLYVLQYVDEPSTGMLMTPNAWDATIFDLPAVKRLVCLLARAWWDKKDAYRSDVSLELAFLLRKAMVYLGDSSVRPIEDTQRWVNRCSRQEPVPDIGRVLDFYEQQGKKLIHLGIVPFRIIDSME